MTATPAKPDFVVVGKVTGAWGVQGWIKLYSYTERRDDIFCYHPWVLSRAGEEVEVRVLEGRRHGGGLVARLEGTTNRDQALRWVGHTISVIREQLPKLPQGQYYWQQLTGLDAVNKDGVVLGKVVAMMETGANDVLVVQGDRERLIPFIPDVVMGVDISQGRIRVDWDPEF